MLISRIVVSFLDFQSYYKIHEKKNYTFYYVKKFICLTFNFCKNTKQLIMNHKIFHIQLRLRLLLLITIMNRSIITIIYCNRIRNVPINN